MKRTILFLYIASMLFLNGCQQLSEKIISYQENYEIVGKEKDEMINNTSETIYESIDRSNLDAKEVIIDPIYKDGEDVILPRGRYKIGGHITGNVYIHDEHGKLLFHDILGTAPLGVESITVDVNGSHIVHVDGFEQAYIMPVTTQLSSELSSGIWEVGKDIEEGSYTVTGSGLGYLQIYEQGESPQVFEVIGGDSHTASKVHLKDGQKLKISGVNIIQFSSNS
ncbi:hypothetical protein [Cytobacillus praedii]|uniref:Uncharacterized protein n=1 Tax=Cytobacillus praedii TaxID=1742358 RepID=A0A4R1AVS7_9BACI|nr:hypothetical protein [Cytobacillus praedii]TCJ01611.1 hypothetical protein E0Y62_23260 [Cytobacillus praedii]